MSPQRRTGGHGGADTLSHGPEFGALHRWKADGLWYAHSFDPQIFVGLKAKGPQRVFQTKLHRCPRGFVRSQPIHGLNELVLEIQRSQVIHILGWLRIDHLEFVTLGHHQPSALFRADAYPIYARRHLQCPVRFECNLEAMPVQRARKRFIDLEERFSASAHDIPGTRRGSPPRGNSGGQGIFIRVLAATVTVGAEEIRIAKRTSCPRPILLQPRPEIATGEPAEDSRATCPGTFALQSEEDVLHVIRHDLLDLLDTKRAHPCARS